MAIIIAAAIAEAIFVAALYGSLSGGISSSQNPCAMPLFCKFLVILVDIISVCVDVVIVEVEWPSGDVSDV